MPESIQAVKGRRRAVAGCASAVAAILIACLASSARADDPPAAIVEPDDVPLVSVPTPVGALRYTPGRGFASATRASPSGATRT